MPIVTRVARSILTHDVNEEVLEQWSSQPWNEKFDRAAKPIQITFGDCVPDVSEADQKIVRKYIHRQWERNNEKGYFMRTPVFRACLEDLSMYNQARFMHRFINASKYGPHEYVFEPDLYDVRIEDVGDTAGLHMPIWILDYLIGTGALEYAEKITKLPGAPEISLDNKCSDSRLTALFRELYVKRKEQNPEERYEYYSKSAEYLACADKMEEFNLKENEEKALGKDTEEKTKTKRASTISLASID